MNFKMMNVVIKQRMIFLFGFGVGFCITFIIFLMQYSLIDFPNCDNENKFQGLSRESVKFGVWLKQASNILKEDLSYEEWFKRQNLSISDIDMDALKYGEKFDKAVESTWLRNKVQVTCLVFVEKLKMAHAAAQTWGTRCNKLYFFSHQLEDSSLPVIKFKTRITSSWQLLCESMNYIWNHSKITDLKWIIFVKDDTMVLPENLRYMVAPLNSKEDYYLGHAVSLWGQDYNVAEAGYVLSKSAFEKIIKKFDTSQKCASGGKYWKKEDFYLGKHLSSMGIHPSDTRDSYQRGTFHGYSLQILFWGVARPGQYWTKALYPPGPICCSPRSVTFSASDATKIYKLNYLLYNFNLFFKNKSSEIELPLKPDDEVWKTVLRDEFGINNMSEISSEQYYQLWQSKYSDPETFLKNKIYNPFSNSVESLAKS